MKRCASGATRINPLLSIIKINYSPQICRIEAKKVILQMKDAIRQRAARFPNVK